jgi:hypothetical protein
LLSKFARFRNVKFSFNKDEDKIFYKICASKVIHFINKKVSLNFTQLSNSINLEEKITIFEPFLVKELYNELLNFKSNI